MLYLVATPIGNLEDITIRALKILKDVDIIACEDTRNTQRLLNHYEIKSKKLISYHEHNELIISEKIIHHIEDGKNVALVSDAGMPCISDPGYILVEKCRNIGINVVAIPGANAGLTALIASGIEAYSYTFYGFLPRKNNDLKKKISEIFSSNTTGIIYESPHRIKKLIIKMVEEDGDKIISICRELTKVYEQIVKDKARNILSKFDENIIKQKGEFVVIVESKKMKDEDIIICDDIINEVNIHVENGIKKSEAIKIISKKYGINKREVYNLYHEKFL